MTGPRQAGWDVKGVVLQEVVGRDVGRGHRDSVISHAPLVLLDVVGYIMVVYRAHLSARCRNTR